ncbi:MAG TPA: hypothetical protein VFB45_10420 [Pseudolabrys sp.]|nr:hypothetical protein [Pseudolabrys sp.]
MRASTIFDERALTVALAELGYSTFKRFAYRADWSTEVEHFLYIHLWGTPKEYLQVDFGLRSKDALAFALRAIETYGPVIPGLPRLPNDPHNCYMRFSFGALAGWEMPPSLTISSMSGAALAQRIQHDIKQKLLPIVRHVTTSERLTALLLIDADPCRWAHCNGAMRAAIIAYLATRQGAEPAEIKTMLEPRKSEILAHLRGASDPDPLRYIEKIVNGAASIHHRGRSL